MMSYNYKKNLRIYRINVIIVLSLFLILSSKIINTRKIYSQYKEGEVAYAQQDYIAAERVYTDIYTKSKFNYFSKKIKDVLNMDEIVFIKESTAVLEEIQNKFKLEKENNEIAAMLEIHNTFGAKLSEVKQSQIKENIKSYNTLIENYNLNAIFSTEFENIAKQFQQDIDKSIESGSFAQEIDFILYAHVLEKVIPNIEEKENIIQEDIKQYYVAKLDWLIEKDNLDNVFVETQKIINDYRSFMEVEWVVDKVTEFAIQKMNNSIKELKYPLYKTLGSKYFAYLSKLPSELSSGDEIKQLVNNQLERDYKKIKSYIASNKFEEAKSMYEAIEEYIAIVNNSSIDMEQLNQDIDILWTKNDPIRMFSPRVLTEIAKGKSRWGKEVYVLATDAKKETVYWGEINSHQEIKQLELDISAYNVEGIFISQELSTQTNPVIFIEEKDAYGRAIYNGYRVEDNNLRKILRMEADYFEVKKQGDVLLAYDSSLLDVTYYELIDGEYVNVFTLGDIEIQGSDEYGYILSGPQNIYSSYEADVVRIFANIRKGYNNNSLLKGSLGINYIKPYGAVLYCDQSTDQYTWSVPINTSDTNEISQGIRGDYDLGVYNVEFWWDDIKIAERQFTITE